MFPLACVFDVLISTMLPINLCYTYFIAVNGTFAVTTRGCFSNQPYWPVELVQFCGLSWTFAQIVSCCLEVELNHFVASVLCRVDWKQTLLTELPASSVNQVYTM